MYEYMYLYTCHVFLMLLICVLPCILLLLQLQYCCLPLLIVIVYVSDGKICCCGSLHSIPVYFFLFIQKLFVLNVPIGSTTVASIYLVNTYHTSSVITCMRGARTGVRPLRPKRDLETDHLRPSNLAPRTTLSGAYT